MVKIRLFIIIFLLFIFFCGCSGGNEMNQERDVFQITNNELPSNELITRKIKINSSNDFCWLTIEEIDNKFNIECLRKVGDIYYAVFDTYDYGLLYLVFSINNDSTNYDHYHVVSYFFPEKSPNSNSFDGIIVNESSMSDVEIIDPLGVYLYGFGRVDQNDFSCHITNDGYIVLIYYNISEPIVVDIKKVINEYFVGNYLLSIDQ